MEGSDGGLEPLQLRLKPLITSNAGRQKLEAQESISPSLSKTKSFPKSGRATRAGSPVVDLSDAYFSELFSSSLERLNKEPDLLQAEDERIHRQLTESAVEHFPAFINSANCLRDMEQELKSFDERVRSLQGGITKFRDSCTAFREGAREIMDRRGDVQKVLGQHQTLLGLLEIPQLMDACVRNNNFDEALDFQLFVNRLGALHGELEVVQILVREVKEVTNLMLRQLMNKLRSNIQLPECLGVIGYLRRLASFSEKELRIGFLGCREEWIASLVSEVDASNPYDYLKRLTDIHRLHMFDVVMQYRAVFSEEAIGGGDGGLLSSWALPRIEFYLDSLGKYMPQVGEGSNIASILEHCMYCGMSLGRVGLDFRGLLPSVFEPCMLQLFSERILAAVENFGNVLDVHKWVSLNTALATQAQVNTVGNGQPSPELAAAPPSDLVEHLPIATFVNGVLAALNDLRHCAAVSLKQPVAALMQECISGVATELSQYSVMRGLEGPQKRVFISACKAYTDNAAPFLCQSLDRLYSGASEMIDLTRACEPLQDLTTSTA